MDEHAAGGDRRAWRLLWGCRRALWIILPLAACEVSLDGCLTISYRFLIDHALLRHDAQATTLILSVLAAWLVAASLLSVWRDWLWGRAVSSMLASVRRALFAHVQRLPVAYHESHVSGTVLSRFSADLAGVEALLSSAVGSVVLPALSVAMGVGLLFYFLSWDLALVGAVVWPLVLLAPRLVAPRAAAADYQRQQAGATLLGSVGEAVSAHRVIKAYGLEGFATRRFEAALAPLSLSLRRSVFLGSLVERSTVIGIYAVQVGAVAVSAWMVQRDLLTVGTFIAFLTVFWNLGWSMVVIARAAPSLVAAAGSLRRLGELLDEPADALDSGSGQPLAPLHAELALHDVCFGYPGRPDVLCGVNLTIHHGEFVAVVGPSGSGKSTLLGLLARFYAPTSGRIEVDGVDLSLVSGRDWRTQLGIVMQESLLFDATVRENLCLERPAIGDEQIEAAARQAEVHDTVMALPAGYDTPVGERGGQLSGGQRQRLALARALAGDPRVLLLDEATSALDAATAAAVAQTLVRAGRGRTTIAVTHLLSSVTAADHIFVLDRGRIVEQGNHAQLLAADGLYADLWRRQSGFSVSDDGSVAAVSPSRLRAVGLLRSVDDERLADLAGKFASTRVAAGEVVFEEGSPGDMLYLIAQGQASVTRRGPDGTALELARLGAGDEFGEMALLNDAPRNATVTARTNCLFLTLTRRNFRGLLDSAPEVRAELERLAASRAASDPRSD
ncbi:MAG: ATP-binding cassette domain-containing protein [Armatimonadetes bacterium]|nr:ATP-binding cassette domain-containing protein [Armatimonadota bacterium]